MMRHPARARAAAMAAALLGGLAACGEPERCWPLRVGAAYEIELHERDPDTVQASCGEGFDLAPGNLLHVRVQAERTGGDGCVTISDASLLDAQLGPVRLDLSTGLRSLATATGRTEYLVLGNSYQAMRAGNLEQRSPGCDGHWGFVLTASERQGNVLAAYVAGEPRVFVNRAFQGTCSDGPRNCADSWAVSVRAFQPEPAP